MLDRYVLRNFLEPFLLCFGGFLAIWLILDLSDNGRDFSEAHVRPALILDYYLIQLPWTALLLLPICLLLALLFCLSRMSRSNEIISMLTAGRSVVRVLMPLFCAGALISVFCLWLNAELVPQAEASKKDAMKKMRENKRASEALPVVSLLFPDRLHFRTWYVTRLVPGANLLGNVVITQQDADGKMLKRWSAASAEYDPAQKTWTLKDGTLVLYKADGAVESEDPFPKAARVLTDWEETPRRIASSELNPQGLTVPELREYLQGNADFRSGQLAPYRTNLADRFALPVSCFIVVLFSAPLGIVYNRRGILGGVSWALGLFFVQMFGRSIFLALGKGERLPPEWSPWIPDICLALVGLLLLWMRSTNRDFPKLAFPRLLPRR